MTIVLVGPMGAGKSTVAALLAEVLGGEARDTDVDVEASDGRTISDIFVESGETHFRALEREAVAKALATDDGVLSLGGGAVLDEGTRQLLADSDHTVVFLRVGLAEAVKRVGLGTSRPLLLGNVRSRIKALLDERTPIYESVADLVVDTDQKSARRRRRRDQEGPGMSTPITDTVLPVRGASPYDVVVGRDLGHHLPADARTGRRTGGRDLPRAARGVRRGAARRPR